MSLADKPEISLPDNAAISAGESEVILRAAVTAGALGLEGILPPCTTNETVLRSPPSVPLTNFCRKFKFCPVIQAHQIKPPRSLWGREEFMPSALPPTFHVAIDSIR